jgi:hypothetical protein
MDGMRKLLIDLETHNLTWARSRVRTARAQQKIMYFQAGFFAAAGSAFLIFFALGGSWWNLMSVGIYFAGSVFFLRRAQGRLADDVRRALRGEAVARIRLRKVMEQG